MPNRGYRHGWRRWSGNGPRAGFRLLRSQRLRWGTTRIGKRLDRCGVLRYIADKFHPQLDMQRAEAYSLASSLVNTIRRQLSRIETERMEFSRLASIKAALVARKSELDEDSEGQDALRGTVVRLQDQSRSLRDRTVKLERELDLLCGKSDELARLLHAETALGEKLARETIRTAARKSDLEQAVAALHSDLATLDTSIATATTKRTDMQVALARHSAESSTALSALASDVSKLRADIAAQGIHLSELGSKLSTQRTEKDNLTRAAEDEEHRFAAAKTKEAEVLREVTAERTGWKAEESKLQSQLDSARQKLSKAQKEVAELERLKKEMVERTEALVKRKEHLEGEIENWKTRAAEEKVKMEELLDKAKEGLDAEEARRRAMQESIVELGNQATADRAAVKQLEADWARERAELAKEQNELRQSIAVDEQETVKLRAEVPEWEARKVEVAHLFATLSEERAGVEDQMTNMESKLEEQQRCVALATSERDEIAERVRLKRMKLEEARKGHDLVQNEIRNEKFRAEKSQKELQGKIAAADRELARLANESKRIANERTKLENEARLAEQGTSRVNVQQEMLNRELDAVSAECNSLRDSELPAIVAECTKYRELIANSETELAESERTLAVDEHPRDNNSGHAHALEEIRKARQAICEISAEAEACLGHAASKGWTGLNDLLFVDFNN